MPFNKLFQRVVSKRERSSSPSPSERSSKASPAASPLLATSPYMQLDEGYFGQSDTSTSVSSASSAISTSSSTSLEHAAAQLRIEEFAPTFRPTVRLLACVDAISNEALAQGIPAEPFWVEMDLDDDVSAVGNSVEKVLGGWGDFVVASCFKVTIPRHAQQQAVQFKQTYGQQVDLLTHFESWNLSDPKQIHASLGHPLSSFGKYIPSMSVPITLGECWPLEKRVRGDDVIPILVRLAAAPSNEPSMTALAYFSKALNPPMNISSPCSPASAQTSTFAQPDSPDPPVAIEVPLSCTVSDLKRIILKADGRPVGALEKCVIWSVDMSWKEMRSCEAFGGLRDAGMPWPYPPTSNPPVKLADGKALVSKYLLSMISNPNLVTFYIHIDRALNGILASEKSVLGNLSDQPSPNFRYPMAFPEPTRPIGTPLRRNSICRQHSYSPPGSPALDRHIAKPVNRRVRPSTAPVGSSTGHATPAGVPAFGARSKPGAKRERSGLGRRAPADIAIGLGIAS